MIEDFIDLLASPITKRGLVACGDPVERLVDEDVEFDVTGGVPCLMPSRPLGEFSETLVAESEYYDSNRSYGQEILDQSRRILQGLDLEGLPSIAPVDATMEYSAQSAALQALGPMVGKTVAQVGGAGLHAVKMLLCGATRAVTVTPFVQEAVVANQLAREFGQGSKHLAVLGIGEALPLAADSFDSIYLGGSLHHLDTDAAARELACVLVPGGTFAAVDPWRTAIYGLGTKVFGKREKDVLCSPMSAERVIPMARYFEHLTAHRFHPVSRYPLILLSTRLPRLVPERRAAKVLSTETRLERHLPAALRDHGSCVAVIGRKHLSDGQVPSRPG